MLQVTGLELAFYSSVGDNSDNNLLSTSALFALLKRVSIVDSTEAVQRLSKDSAIMNTADYVDYMLSDTTENPLQIDFTQIADLLGGSDSKFVILAEFQDEVANRGFRTVLKNIDVYDPGTDTQLEVIDYQGMDIEDSEEMESRAITVVSDDPKETFGNYPNPFGRTYKNTNIIFQLEDASDVDVRIFTLIGEPVWHRSYSGLPPGVYENMIRWDGKNDRGYVVLNGVYLCIMDVNPLNGQSNKRYITKIAYIK